MIDGLVHGLAASRDPDFDAEEILDILWLSAVYPAGQAEQAGPGDTAPHPEDTGSQPDDSTAAQDALPPDTQSRREDVGDAASAPAVGFDAPSPLQRVATLPMAVRRLRKVVAPGPRLVVDIDATVEATAEARQLMPVLTRPPQRALDLALVVDDSLSMRIWHDVFDDLEQLLAQTSAFRSVSRWRLATGEGAIRPHTRHRDDDQVPAAPLQRPEQLVDPSGRRLVLIATDARDRSWYDEAPWGAIDTWCAAMPTVLVQVLPQQYWADTAVGIPYMTSRALTPAAPNSQYERRLAWWTADADPGGLPLPVVTLAEKSLDTWAQSIVNGTAWASGITATPPDPGFAPPADDEIDAGAAVNGFLAKATPGAQRLARILASADTPLSMPLISVLRGRLAPEAGVAELAEIMASGLLEDAGPANGAGQSLLRYRNGAREILCRGTTAFEDWDAFAAVGEYREARQADKPLRDFQHALAVRYGLRPRAPDPIEAEVAADPESADAREQLETSQEQLPGTGPTETADDDHIADSGELRDVLDAAIAGLGDGDEVKVATFGDNGIAVWGVARDENGTPQAQQTVLATAFVAAPEVFYEERLAPSLGDSPLLVVCGAPDQSHAAVFRLLRAARGARAFGYQAPFADLLREAIGNSRLTRWYDLVVLNEEPGGKLQTSRLPLFQPGAVSGGRTEPFHVRCAPTDNRGTVFAVVAHGPSAEPFLTSRLHPVQVQSAVVAPGTYWVTALLSRPGRVRFDGLPALLSAEQRPLAELLRQLPEQLRVLEPVHLACLIEVSGGDARLRRRIDRLEQLIAAADAGTRELSVSVISYGPHAVERGVPDEPATLLARATTAERAIRVLRGLMGRRVPAHEYERAAQTECALDELSRLLSARNGRDGRPVVVTAGGRPPHPPRVDIQSEIIPCPRRVDWNTMIARLQKVPAIRFGALYDPNAIGVIWRGLGRDAIATVDRVDIPGFARQLGLVKRTQGAPFPLLQPGAATVGRVPKPTVSRDGPVRRGGIAMLGPPGSGKTTFLGALSVALQNRQQEQQDRTLAERHDDPIRLMIETTGAPSASTGLLPAALTDEPIHFDVIRPEAQGAEIARRDQPGEVARRSTEITVNLVDPTGELWSDDFSPAPGLRDRREMIRHIADTDGILYLFDPLREFEAGDTLLSINRLIAQVTQEVAGSGEPDFDGTLPHHVAVCVTKFDEPRVLAIARRMGKVTRDPDDAYGFPRVRDSDARQVFARLCNGSGQALLNTIDSAFHEDRVRYFVTSAIGFRVNPETGRFGTDDSESVVRPSPQIRPAEPRSGGPVNPINVVEPVLWLAGQIAGA